MASGNSTFKKIHNLYLNTDYLNNNSYAYGTKRQHNFSSIDSTLPSFSTLVDKAGFNKFFNYSLNTFDQKNNLTNSILPFTTVPNSNNEPKYTLDGSFLLNLKNIIDLPLNGTGGDNIFLSKWISQFYNNYNLNNTTDGKNDNNPYITFSKINPVKKNNVKSPLINPVSDEIVNSNLDSFYT
jgi:hypothetical protein